MPMPNDRTKVQFLIEKVIKQGTISENCKRNYFLSRVHGCHNGNARSSNKVQFLIEQMIKQGTISGTYKHNYFFSRVHGCHNGNAR
jgi:polyhydroxyalkanoate synthesis regulator phasin